MNACFKILPLLFLFACGSRHSGAGDTDAAVAKQPEVTDEVRAKVDHDIIINYAADNFLHLQNTPSGLYYQVLAEGQGLPLSKGQKVLVHYRGSLPDGSEFDSSYARNEAIECVVGDGIPGWSEGLQLTKMGGKIRLFMPSALAYGKEGVLKGTRVIVPPHAVVIYEIEVMEIL